MRTRRRRPSCQRSTLRPTEDQRLIPRRLYIRVTNDTVPLNCKGCTATLRVQGGEPHTDTCRKRLTDEIGKSDEGERVKRARQMELEFYEQAIKDSDQVAKRKGVAMEEEGSAKRTRDMKRRSHLQRSGVARGERRGEKRAAEDPPADGRENSVDEKGESKNDEDVSMDRMSFQAYWDTGGVRMVACREPDEDIEEGEGGELSGGQAPDQCGTQFHDDRTKNHWLLKSFGRPEQRSFGNWIGEYERKPTCRSVGTKGQSTDWRSMGRR